MDSLIIYGSSCDDIGSVSVCDDTEVDLSQSVARIESQSKSNVVYLITR